MLEQIIRKIHKREATVPAMKSGRMEETEMRDVFSSIAIACLCLPDQRRLTQRSEAGGGGTGQSAVFFVEKELTFWRFDLKIFLPFLPAPLEVLGVQLTGPPLALGPSASVPQEPGGLLDVNVNAFWVSVFNNKPMLPGGTELVGVGQSPLRALQLG